MLNLRTIEWVAGLLLVVVVGVGLHAAPVRVPLIEAVKTGDVATVQRLLSQRVDVNAPEADGTTALHWAVRRDDLKTTDQLIRAGAKATSANRFSVTPLSLACQNGNAALIERLIAAGADANTALPGGETVLMTASRTGKVDAVQVLLEHGANVNAAERRGQTALMWAAAEGHVAVIQALLARGADIRAQTLGQGFTPLLFAARDGQIASVRALLEAGANPNENLRPGAIRRPYGASADPVSAPQPTGLTPLLLAVGSAHYELAAVLLKAGADPNAAPEGWTALHQIPGNRKYSTASESSPPPTGSGTIDSLTFVKTLVAHGADVNARATRNPNNLGSSFLNAVGATPFWLAARADAELMRLLVELGADPQLSNEDQTTPLMVAAGVGTDTPEDDAGTEADAIAAMKVALELGADINAVDKAGDTVMHGAAYKQFPAVVRFLAAQGTKIAIWNQPNKCGWTPLAISRGIAKSGNIQMSPATEGAIREVMRADGVEPPTTPHEIVRSRGACSE